MRVALLTTSWPVDDADATGRFLVQPVRDLEAAGVTVDVIAPGRGFNDFGLAGGAGVVANAKRRPWRLPLMLGSMVISLRRAARRADVVHSNWLLTSPFAAMSGKPVVLTLHGSGTAGRFADLELARHRPRLFRWLVRRARVVIGVSEPLVEAARAGGARQVALIPHGVDVPEPRDEPAGRPVVMFAGRLSPEKGVQVLADATRDLDGIELVVAGDGSLRHLVPDALGFVPHAELQRLYRRAAMLVVPSYHEGFGVVALEAMSHGVPVIATNVGGLRWLVEDEVTGIVVPPGDPDAVRSAIERLRDDPSLRQRLGAAGRERARNRFAREAVARRTMDAYGQALGRSATASAP